MNDIAPDIASVSLAQPARNPLPMNWAAVFAEYGFAVVRDHGIPQELIDEAEGSFQGVLRAARQRPSAAYQDRRRRRGRAGRLYRLLFGTEKAQEGDAGGVSDLKEFWHVRGRSLRSGHPAGRIHGAPNIWPDEIDKASVGKR